MQNNNQKKAIRQIRKPSEQTKKKHKAKLSKPLIITLCIFILALLFLFLPFFRIQTIEIKNADFVSVEKIIEHSGIKENQHFLQGFGGKLNDFFGGHYAKAEENIRKSVPQVSDISITYSFPNTIVFDVEERIAIGWIKIPDGYCTIDSKGVVIEILNQEPDDLPVIKGVRIININLGKQIDVDQSAYLENAMYTMSALIEADLDLEGQKLLNTIHEIEPTINGNIYLYMVLHEQDIVVICNQSRDLKNNFLWLKQLVNSEAIADKGSGTIDLRGKTRTFKPNSLNEATESEEVVETDGGTR